MVKPGGTGRPSRDISAWSLVLAPLSSSSCSIVGSGRFSGPPTFTQTALSGNGLRASGLGGAQAAIGDEIAGADQPRPRRFLQAVGPGFDRAASVEAHLDEDAVEHALRLRPLRLFIFRGGNALIFVEGGEEPGPRPKHEDVAYHAVLLLRPENGAGIVAEIVEQAGGPSLADVLARSSQPVRHRVRAPRSQRAVNEQMIWHRFSITPAA